MALPQYSRNRLRTWIDGGRVTLDGSVAAPTRKVWGGERVVVQVEPESRRHGTVARGDPARDRVRGRRAARRRQAGRPGRAPRQRQSGAARCSTRCCTTRRSSRQFRAPASSIVSTRTRAASSSSPRRSPRRPRSCGSWQARTVRREYVALAQATSRAAATVDAPIGRHPTRRTTMAVVATGKPARTHYDVVERFGAATLLRCRLETGRTHQIRVHLASLGHPLVGDPAYGKRGSIAFARQALHAARLALRSPCDRQSLRMAFGASGGLRRAHRHAPRGAPTPMSAEARPDREFGAHGATVFRPVARSRSASPMQGSTGSFRIGRRPRSSTRSSRRATAE